MMTKKQHVLVNFYLQSCIWGQVIPCFCEIKDKMICETKEYENRSLSEYNSAIYLLQPMPLLPNNIDMLAFHLLEFPWHPNQ